MKSFINLFSCSLVFFLASHLLAETERKLELIDKICAKVPGEARPILLSEVKERAKNDNLDLSSALLALRRDRALRIHAANSISMPDINQGAENYISDIMEKNKLSRNQFINILRAPPHSTTIEQYAYNISNSILKNHLTASISYEPSEGEQEKALQDNWPQEVYFISLAIKPNSELSHQIKRLNTIKQDLTNNKFKTDVINNYEKVKEVSIIGPIGYGKDVLKKHYEDELAKNPGALATEPFQEGDFIRVIVKQKKLLNAEEKKTALEKARKELYESYATLHLNNVADGILANVSVEIYCTW